ncbi:MAG: hypothetical protein Q8M08_13185 [Bacteroidales bacterium]|nr:hypothetical protein [Bacteroidales bacterium]
MIVKSNILIIGSTGRNTGKTEFACRIIEKQAVRKEIIGVKVIPVDKNESDCHRGLEGCGLCNSLTGDYEIIKEKAKDTPKDTSRMLKAGAKKAYLLLVDRNSLEKGINAVLRILPDDVLIVIESNSIRKVIKPGLFIVINEFTNVSVKRTCAEVIEFADKVIEFGDISWNFDPDKVLIQDEGWIIKE